MRLASRSAEESPTPSWAFLDVENLLYPWDDGNWVDDEFDFIVQGLRRLDRRIGIVAVSTTHLATRIAPMAGVLGVRLHRCHGGPDAADHELLARMRFDLPARCSRVVVGSGDGAFALIMRRMRLTGRHVSLLARRGSVASALLRVSDDVHLLPPNPGRYGRKLPPAA